MPACSSDPNDLNARDPPATQPSLKLSNATVIKVGLH